MLGKEMIAFIFLANVIVLVFIVAVIVFVFQYNKRKQRYEREKKAVNDRHIQDLLNTRLAIQQQTMQDIGREIHDNVGQKLTLASIYANQAVFKQPADGGQIGKVAELINEALHELRGLSKNLTAAHADLKELEQLVAAECHRVNALNLCRVQYRFSGTDYLISATIKNFVLRIVQEFLQNSLKHAFCEHIVLYLEFNDSGLSLQASDDGVGFETGRDRSGAGEGIGLQNMKKRAELMGADFSLTSRINGGTALSLNIPISKMVVT